MTRLMSTTLGLALLAGCTLRYDVEMKPQGRSLHRSITVNEEVLDAELESLRAALGPERIEVGDAHETPPQRFGPADLDRMAAAGLPGSRATLTFSSDTGSGPWSDGFSGLGAWTTYDSPLGTATCFLECIGGDVDLAGDLLHLQTAIDAAVREARLHVQEVLDGHPLRTRLLSLLRNRIHPDARDAVTLAWVMIMGRQMLPSGSAGDDDADRGLLREHADKVLVEASTAFLWQRDWITTNEAIEHAQHEGLSPEAATWATPGAHGTSGLGRHDGCDARDGSPGTRGDRFDRVPRSEPCQPQATMPQPAKERWRSRHPRRSERVEDREHRGRYLPPPGAARR